MSESREVLVATVAYINGLLGQQLITDGCIRLNLPGTVSVIVPLVDGNLKKTFTFVVRRLNAALKGMGSEIYTYGEHRAKLYTLDGTRFVQVRKGLDRVTIRVTDVQRYKERA